MKKKLIVLLLSLAMVVTMMPLSVFADTDNLPGDEVKAKDLKKGDIIRVHCNDASLVDEGILNQDGEVSFTVIDNETTTGSSQGIFCVADKIMTMGSFAESSCDYSTSVINAWCHKLLSKLDESFTKNLISTTKDEEDYTYDIEQPIGTKIGELNIAKSGIYNEKIFIPSASELFLEGIFPSDESRVAYNAAGETPGYWSRSGGTFFPARGVVPNSVARVFKDGRIMTTTTKPGFSDFGYRPGFNLSSETLLTEGSDGCYRVAHSHQVEFRSNLGFVFETQMVKDGECAKMPEIPKVMRIEKWYTLEGDKEVPFDFSKPITKNITVFGKTTVLYTVTFMVDGDVYQTEQVADGHFVKKPTDPVKKGYKFNGWFISPDAAGSGFDFENTPITKNTILYADWIKESKPDPNPNPNPNPKPPINHNTTGKTTNTKGLKGIKTGDNSIAILLAGLGAVAIGTALVIGLRRKERNK